MYDDQLRDLEEKSFVERYSVNPAVFAIIVLVSIFIIYQGVGAILTFIVIGRVGITSDVVWQMRWLMAGSEICLIFIPTLIFARLFTRKSYEVFKFRIPGGLESLLALLSFLALQRVFEAYIFFQELIPLPDAISQIIEPIKESFKMTTKLLIRSETSVELLFVIFVAAVVPAIVEELLFRGLIQRIFEKVMSPLVSAVLAGTIFGLYHMNPFEIIPLIGLGVFFGILRYRSGTLTLPIALHFLNNFMSVLASYFGLNEDNLLSKPGATVGVETMLFELMLSLGLFFVTFIAYLRTTRDISRNFYR